MPTLRDLVSALRQRPGIDAAVVVGRDGLVIAGDASPSVDLDELAARVPPLIDAFEALAPGTTSAVLAHTHGHLAYVALGGDDVLLLLAHESTEIAQLVSDLRRYRGRIAELV
jgi:uncharacterized protein